MNQIEQIEQLKQIFMRDSVQLFNFQKGDSHNFFILHIDSIIEEYSKNLLNPN
jgi:hypothetical protein